MCVMEAHRAEKAVDSHITYLGKDSVLMALFRQVSTDVRENHSHLLAERATKGHNAGSHAQVDAQ